MIELYDVLIIGHGPAGVSAAIYAARAGMGVLLAGKDAGALGKAMAVENYYGHALPVSGKALTEAGLAQAKRLGVHVETAEIFNIRKEYACFEAVSDKMEFQAKTLVLATGVTRKPPKLDGLAELEGKGVSYCAICDAFFFRGKDVAVLGAGPYALHEAKTLQNVVGTVTICTNGQPIDIPFTDDIRIVETKLKSLVGSERLLAIEFEDGTRLDASGLFVAEGTSAGSGLARSIGATLQDNHVKVDAKQCTSIPGLYAAGDCTIGVKQIARAVYEGMVAGFEAAEYVRSKEAEVVQNAPV